MASGHGTNSAQWQCSCEAIESKPKANTSKKETKRKVYKTNRSGGVCSSESKLESKGGRMRQLGTIQSGYTGNNDRTDARKSKRGKKQSTRMRGIALVCP